MLDTFTWKFPFWGRSSRVGRHSHWHPRVLPGAVALALHLEHAKCFPFSFFFSYDCSTLLESPFHIQVLKRACSRTNEVIRRLEILVFLLLYTFQQNDARNKNDKSKTQISVMRQEKRYWRQYQRCGPKNFQYLSFICKNETLLYVYF